MCAVRQLAIASIASVVALVAVSRAADEVNRRGSKIPLRGTITAETPTGVTIKATQAGKSEEVAVPLNELIEVQYDGQPGLSLQSAELVERGGDFRRALELYQKAAAAGPSGFVAAAVAFGQARTLAKTALTNPQRLDEAIQGLETFRTQHPQTRFHYDLHEWLGRLQLEKGNASAAGTAFRELAAAPWPDYRLRAATWEGRVLLRAGNYEAAQAKFEEVAAAKATTEPEKLRQQEALLAKGECLLKLKKLDEAEALLRRVIDQAPPDHAEVQALAHNALGDALREAGRPKEALLAYLRVDLLYNTQKQAHARALYHAALLWDQVGRGPDAAEARDKLKRLYADSTWAKQAN